MAAETCACGAPLDDGEGYDGQCGNCADRAEKKRQAVIDTLRWLGYMASSELLERDPSWQEHFESLLSNKTREMTDEQRLAIWPDWTRSPLEEIALTARPFGGPPHVGPDSLPAMKARREAQLAAARRCFRCGKTAVIVESDGDHRCDRCEWRCETPADGGFLDGDCPFCVEPEQ